MTSWRGWLPAGTPPIGAVLTIVLLVLAIGIERGIVRPAIGHGVSWAAVLAGVVWSLRKQGRLRRLLRLGILGLHLH